MTGQDSILGCTLCLWTGEPGTGMVDVCPRCERGVVGRVLWLDPGVPGSRQVQPCCGSCAHFRRAQGATVGACTHPRLRAYQGQILDFFGCVNWTGGR